MLQIKVGGMDLYDEVNNLFFTPDPVTLCLEHSLISISKWESRWEKPYFDDAHTKTTEEILDYIRCMTVSPQNVSDYVYLSLSDENIRDISKYINSSMTATTFTTHSTNKTGPKNSEIVTSELIYYWMVSYGIPFECQKWPINRLLTLIRICSIKNGGSNKMSKQDSINYMKAENERRKALWKTHG